MDFEKVKKSYIRFLKDRGIYVRVKKILFGNGKEEFKSIDDLYKHYRIKAPYWFENTSFFCLWCNTPEGDTYWWRHSVAWKDFCRENGLSEEVTTAREILSEIDSISRRNNVSPEQLESLMSLRAKYVQIRDEENNKNKISEYEK